MENKIRLTSENISKDLGMMILKYSGPIQNYIKNSDNNSVLNYFLSLQKYCEENYELIYQIVNPAVVFSSTQIKHIILQLEEGFKLKNNISKSKGMEILVYLSNTRKIKVALSKCGINEEKDMKKDTQIEFIEIFFGSSKNIQKFIEDYNAEKQTIQFLNKSHENFVLMSEQNWTEFVHNRKISVLELINILKSNNISVSLPPKNEIDVSEIIKEPKNFGINFDILKNAIEDALIMRNVNLFIKNY